MKETHKRISKKTTKDTKHNWFDFNGSIRTDKPMTIREFHKALTELFDSVGWEFLGGFRYSEIDDSYWE